MCSLLLTDRHSQIEGWLLIALGCKQREDVAVIMLLLHLNDICGPFPLQDMPCMTEICIQKYFLWHLYFNLLLNHNNCVFLSIAMLCVLIPNYDQHYCTQLTYWPAPENATQVVNRWVD